MFAIVNNLMHLRENGHIAQLKRTVYYLPKEDKAELLTWLCLVFWAELEHITYSALIESIKKEFYL